MIEVNVQTIGIEVLTNPQISYSFSRIDFKQNTIKLINYICAEY